MMTVWDIRSIKETIRSFLVVAGNCDYGQYFVCLCKIFECVCLPAF